jgi:hypothetical protein
MNPVAAWLLGGAIVASAVGALVVCVLVFKYEFSTEGGEAHDGSIRRSVSRLGHGVAAACFVLAAGLAMAGVGARVGSWPFSPHSTDLDINSVGHRVSAVESVARSFQRSVALLMSRVEEAWRRALAGRDDSPAAGIAESGTADRSLPVRSTRAPSATAGAANAISSPLWASAVGRPERAEPRQWDAWVFSDVPGKAIGLGTGVGVLMEPTSTLLEERPVSVSTAGGRPRSPGREPRVERVDAPVAPAAPAPAPRSEAVAAPPVSPRPTPAPSGVASTVTPASRTANVATASPAPVASPPSIAPRERSEKQGEATEEESSRNGARNDTSTKSTTADGSATWVKAQRKTEKSSQDDPTSTDGTAALRRERSDRGDTGDNGDRPATADRATQASRADRTDRGDAADRADRTERADRGDRADRADRGDAGNAIVDRVDQTDRVDRADRVDRVDRSDRADRPDPVDRTFERVDRISRPERVDRVDRPEPVQRVDRVERLDRVDRTERAQLPDRPDRAARPDRIERPERARK